MNLLDYQRAPMSAEEKYAGLRYYQVDAARAVVAALEAHRSALVVMATGLGKTETFGALARMWPGKVLVLAHRDELVDQARKRIEKMSGEWVEIEKGPHHAQLSTRIVVASINTIYQQHRLDRFGPDHFSLIIPDEAHHYVAKSFRRPLEYFTKARVVGFTATPDRKDKKAMGQAFENCPFVMDIEDGIEAGYLVPVIGQRVHLDEIDLSKVKSVAGDLQQGQLEEAMLPAVEGVVRKTLELHPDRKAIAFFPGVKNAELACQVFNRMDPDSTCFISGETDDAERQQLVRDFRKGRYRRLCNCDIATEGFDDPEVSLIVGARPTKSRAKYTQMGGRGTRVLPGTVDHIGGVDGASERRALIAASAKRDMVMLDFVGNSGKHTLCTIEDVLGGKYTEHERAEAKRKTGTGATNTRDALREARKTIAAAAAAVEAAKIKARVEAFNPFKVLAIHDEVAAELEQRMHTHQPLEARQVKMLEKFGYTDKDLKGASKRQADKLLAESIRRTRGGLASFRQLKLLQRYGVTDTSITKQRAHAAIGYLESVGWGHKMVQTPFGEAKGRVDPRELQRILRNRQPGEDG